MRLFFRKRFGPVKLALVSVIFMIFVFILQRDVVKQSPEDESWFKDLSGRKDRMLGIMFGAVNNIRDSMPKFQIIAPDRGQEIVDNTKNCLPGFYTAAELKTFLPRPPEDPNAPGVDAKAFHTDNLSPEQQKEKERGFEKHCFNAYASDRISFHRSLGPDTRPPEYDILHFFCQEFQCVGGRMLFGYKFVFGIVQITDVGKWRLPQIQEPVSTFKQGTQCPTVWPFISKYPLILK